ncbi:MAG: ABC transporter substrate-binding protein [Acidimicrobiaceae bacterium]|nr:ABC transporter substrate-binding protein [Acidimicrobiaceae bacterium]
MTARLRSLLTIVAGVALVAAACGGEVSVSVDTEDREAAPTTQAPDTAEPATTQAADTQEADQPPDTVEPDDSTEAPDDQPATTEPAEESETTTTQAAEEPDDAQEADAPEETTTTEPAEPEGPPPNIYEDPRGGIFAEYQATMDRGDHPFMQIDQFCVAHDPAPDRVATDTGIEANSISIVHLRTRLEDLVDIGFGTDVGDPAEMFETYVAVVNEQCGGIRGRMIELHTIEAPAYGDTVDAERNAACIQAIEDLDAVVVVNSSGFGGSAILCIVEVNETAFITSSSPPLEFMERSGDRLIVSTATAEEQLSWLALDLIAQGQLDGRTVGVVSPDTPGVVEAVEGGLVDVLRDNGVDVAVFSVIGCQGGTVCAEGSVDSAQQMRAAGIDVFFNTLNVISAPLYINEMLAQGFKPGDVQFYASDFNSQAAELVASKIVQFSGEAGGALYNGAIILDSRDTGAYRLEGYEPRAFNEMCNDTYGANSPSGANHEAEDRYEGNARYGMTSSVCMKMRILLRGLYDAGDNPTRTDIYAALANLGAVDSNEMYPSSIRPGKTRTPDVIHNLVFEFPCTKPYPFKVEGFDDGICLYPINEYRPTPS